MLTAKHLTIVLLNLRIYIQVTRHPANMLTAQPSPPYYYLSYLPTLIALYIYVRVASAQEKNNAHQLSLYNYFSPYKTHESSRH